MQLPRRKRARSELVERLVRTARGKRAAASADGRRRAPIAPRSRRRSALDTRPHRHSRCALSFPFLSECNTDTVQYRIISSYYLVQRHNCSLGYAGVALSSTVLLLRFPNSCIIRVSTSICCMYATARHRPCRHHRHRYRKRTLCRRCLRAAAAPAAAASARAAERRPLWTFGAPPLRSSRTLPIPTPIPTPTPMPGTGEPRITISASIRVQFI